MKKLITILILLHVISFAQETSQMRVVGNGKLAEGEFVGSNVVDANQEICAGLIILSDLTGLSYTSYNGIVKIDRKPGRDLLFLSPTERVVEVYKEGYKPLKIILSEFDVFLKTRMVHQLEVTGDKKVDAIPVNIKTTPSGATIYINGINKGTETVHQLGLGKHQIRLELSGYRSIEEEIEVTATKSLFEYTLKEIEPLLVNFTSTPTGAKIFIDNFDKGSTNRDLFLYPGKYRVKITLSGYIDKEEEIEVKENVSNKFSYTLTKNSGTLTLNITPSEATVKINREDYTNRKTVELPPGTYKIDISKEGYTETSDVITLELGEPITKNYTLIERTGTLQFSVQPTDAKVKLTRNNREVENWEGSKYLRNIQIGSYTLEVTRSGYETTTKQITITENKTTAEDITLKQITAAVQSTTTVSKAGEPEMVFVEGGTFMMGSNDGDSDEKPIHSVTVSSFYIGKYEVTQKEWRDVMGNNPSYFKGDNLPVEKVSWNDVQEFIRKLNQKTGQNYRLPTEAEWEYAARGGASTSSATGYKFSGSNNIDEVAWYSSNSGSKTKPVGMKKPNELGIYDMSGNVWEWCNDWYGAYTSDSKTNPKGPGIGSLRVFRGGGWNRNAVLCRSTDRLFYLPGHSDFYMGFRLARPVK